MSTSKINVVVHCVSAAQPFHDAGADPAELLSHLRARVLAAFGFAEDGSTTFQLYHDKDELKDLSVTIGQLAGKKGALQLKLVKQVTQGEQ